MLAKRRVIIFDLQSVCHWQLHHLILREVDTHLYLKYTFGPQSQLDQTAKQPGKEETGNQYNLMFESQGFLSASYFPVTKVKPMPS